jgi:hypothetical protein
MIGKVYAGITNKGGFSGSAGRRRLLCSLQAGGAIAAVKQVHVHRAVHCHGGAVEGIWVNDSAGGSGWATRYVYSAGDTSDNRYGITLPEGTFSFSVGCGGSTKTWGTVNNSPKVNLATLRIPTLAQHMVPPDFSPAYTVNMFCGNGSKTGPCHFPDPGKTNRQINPAGSQYKCECTYEALNWWHTYEGIFPLWSGNAGTWGGSGAGTPAYNGWDTTSVPMADSIVVFPDFGSGDLADGHVGWVTVLIPGPNHTVAGIYVNQGNVDGDGECLYGNDIHYNTAFYFADPVPGMAFPAASSWRYVVAPNPG